jgi:hypothetical protein
MAAIRPSVIPTSLANVSFAVTTVPFLITVSNRIEPPRLLQPASNFFSAASQVPGPSYTLRQTRRKSRFRWDHAKLFTRSLFNIRQQK